MFSYEVFLGLILYASLVLRWAREDAMENTKRMRPRRLVLLLMPSQAASATTQAGGGHPPDIKYKNGEWYGSRGYKGILL
jgi:hypothetical protein